MQCAVNSFPLVFFPLINFSFNLRLTCKADLVAVGSSWYRLKQNFKSSHALGEKLEKKKAFLELKCSFLCIGYKIIVCLYLNFSYRKYVHIFLFQCNLHIEKTELQLMSYWFEEERHTSGHFLKPCYFKTTLRGTLIVTDKAIFKKIRLLWTSEAQFASQP